MPANYTIPPWLQPQPIVQSYLQGAGLGANIGNQIGQRALAQAQMGQRAGEFADTQLLQQREMAEAAERYQKEYDLRKYQAEAEIGLRQQSAAQQAAQYASQMMAINAIEQDIKGGVAPAQAYARHLARYNLGLPLGSGASLITGLERQGNPRFGMARFGQQSVPFVQNPDGRVNFVPRTALSPGTVKVQPTPQEQYELRMLYENYRSANSAYQRAAVQTPASQRASDPTYLSAEAHLQLAKRAFEDYWKKHPELAQRGGIGPNMGAIDGQGINVPRGTTPGEQLYEDESTGSLWRYNGANPDPFAEGEEGNWEQVEQPVPMQ